MIKILQPFFISLTLLTRIPIPASWFCEDNSDATYSKSVLYYALVGLFLGLILSVFAVFLPAHFNPALKAALVLALWIFLTGALHLDGLADATDAYFASHKNPERTLSVFRDANIGAMGAVAIGASLILKFALLTQIINHAGNGILLTALVIARTLAGIYVATTPYAREQGIATALNVYQYRWWLVAISLFTIATTFLFSPAIPTLVTWVAVFSVFLWWRQLWLKTIGGFTGDCIGALVELLEITVLLVAAFYLSPSI